MWGLLTVLVGGLFGWMTPGLRNKDRVLRIGLVIGVIVGLVLALFGAMIGSPPLAIGTEPAEVTASVIAMTVFFVAGVWAGDVLQRHRAAAE